MFFYNAEMNIFIGHSWMPTFRNFVQNDLFFHILFLAKNYRLGSLYGSNMLIFFNFIAGIHDPWP